VVGDGIMKSDVSSERRHRVSQSAYHLSHPDDLAIRAKRRLGRVTPGHLPCSGCSAPGPAGFDRVCVTATGLEFVCYLEFSPGRPGKAGAGVAQLWPLVPRCRRL